MSTIRSRSILAALLALLLAFAIPACGGDDDGGGGGGGGGGDDDAAALLDKAFKTNVKSADLKVDVKGSAQGAGGGDFSVSLSGPFESQGPKKLPLLDWDFKVNASGQNIEGGLILAKDNAYITFKGQTYEVGKAIFTQYSKQLESQSAGAPKSLDDLGLEPASWLKDPKVEDGDDIGGDSTKVVTGAVDVRAIVDDFFKALQNPAIKKQLEAQGQSIEKPSASDLKEVEDAIKKLDLEINVDDDDVLRRVFLDADIVNPDKKSEKANGTLEVSLESVGEGADIKEPSGARPITELLQQFGGGLGGGGLGGGSAKP